jgi:hypothetical protein
MFTPRVPKCHSAAENGVAVIVLLFALSIFSVLSLTVLRNPALEAVLRTSDKSDLHVVLYAAGAGSPEVIGRLNLPTAWREESATDISAEVRAPGLVGSDLRGEFQPGWAYKVELTKDLRVCCDGGDNACRDIPWDQPVPEAKVSPALDRAVETTTTGRELQFSLSSADIADNVVLDPNAVADGPFLIKAAKVQDGSAAPAVDGAAVSCRLDTREKKLAEGALQLQPGTDRQGQVNRVSAGTLKLNYQAPKN